VLAHEAVPAARLTPPADTVSNLSVPDFVLDGRVVDGGGTPVPGVAFSMLAFAQNQCCGGFDDVSATSGTDGRFSVRILANS
jgi:hypothetical protein